MPTIAFVGKGGTAKTTVAVNLACALARKGLKVGLCDLDHRGGAGDWLRAQPDELIPVLPNVSDGDDDVDLRIIDTEGRSKPDATLIYLPKRLDLVLVPSAPVDGEIKAARLVLEALHERLPNVPVRLLWTRITKNAKKSDPEALAEHAKSLGVVAIRQVMTRSTEYESTQTEGWRALNKAHREEMEAIAVEILLALGGKNKNR